MARAPPRWRRGDPGERRRAAEPDARRRLALNVYADTSLLVAIITPDAFSTRAKDFIESDRPTLLISDFAAAEFASALARRVRTRELTKGQAQEAFATFDGWAAYRGTRLEVTSFDVTRAETFLRRLDFALRTPDALHIAIAQRHDAALATFDAQMATAARTLGLEVAAA
ncbi:MAG: type II toxin-antitoxin system VapC family toxin [Caulobacteraceae bacterium]